MKALPEILKDETLIEAVNKLANSNMKTRFPLCGDNWLKMADTKMNLEALAELLEVWLGSKKNVDTRTKV